MKIKYGNWGTLQCMWSKGDVAFLREPCTNVFNLFSSVLVSFGECDSLQQRPPFAVVGQPLRQRRLRHATEQKDGPACSSSQLPMDTMTSSWAPSQGNIGILHLLNTITCSVREADMARSALLHRRRENSCTPVCFHSPPTLAVSPLTEVCFQRLKIVWNCSFW